MYIGYIWLVLLQGTLHVNIIDQKILIVYVILLVIHAIFMVHLIFQTACYIFSYCYDTGTD